MRHAFWSGIAFAKSVARRVLYFLLASFGGGPNANSRKWVRELEPTEGIKEVGLVRAICVSTLARKWAWRESHFLAPFYTWGGDLPE